ncbi:MAG: FGGY family carbohydrate kinase [Alphaproteobacteria bacterium]|nr:FGGY family carbohydrate kinase [Alphaproteobacteria bacterium]
MTRDLYLAIDVGTGGLRSALVDRQGRILAISHKEHEQIVPRFGWSEQRPADWWAGTQATIRAVIGKVNGAADRVAAICACGQMHGAVLIDDDGIPTLDSAPLWNDKRTVAQVDAFVAAHGVERGLVLTANVPAPAWPAFKVAWIAENHPDALKRATTLLMPKDWINFKLTGERAQDFTEASLSYLMDWQSRTWSDELCAATGTPRGLLAPLKSPGEVLGGLTRDVAESLGLPADLPVLVGAGDYPMALLGSGVMRAGMGSDVTGTSSIITLLHDNAILEPEVSNVLTPNGVWGVMTLVEAGGDAVRWARRAFHENRRSYAEVAETAALAPAGSGGVFFLPYLSGERVAKKRNSRAQFFGLKAETGLAHLHRAVLEGVAFSVRRVLDKLPEGRGRPERIIAASGGAKSDLWLKIKASMYGVPYLVPEELECGVVGAATLMAVSTGDAPDLDTAVARMVRFGAEIAPDPEWADLYDRMAPIYAGLYAHAQDFYDDLDAL